MDGFLANIIKYLILATNLLVFIGGCTMFVAGIWVAVDKTSFVDLFEKVEAAISTDVNVNVVTTAAVIFIIVSVVIIIVSFLGCCGAWKENKCLLGSYFGITLVLFILLIAAAVTAYTSPSYLDSAIKKPLKKSIEQFENDPPKDSPKFNLKKSWNQAQKDFRCCGIEDAGDWAMYNNATFVAGVMAVPGGCCEFFKNKTTIPDEAKAACLAYSGNDYKENKMGYAFDGCFAKMKDKIVNNANIVVYISLVIIFILFLEMIFSFSLCMMVE